MPGAGSEVSGNWRRVSRDGALGDAFLGEARGGEARTFTQVQADREDDHRDAGVLEAALDHEGGLVVENARGEGVLVEDELAGDEEAARIFADEVLRELLGFDCDLDARRELALGGQSETLGVANVLVERRLGAGLDLVFLGDAL